MLSSELKDELLQFVKSQITITQLEDWLVPRLPFFLRSPNSNDADVVAAVELGLVEVSNGTQAADEFRNELKKELGKFVAISASFPATMTQLNETGTANHMEGTHRFSRQVSTIIVAQSQ